MLLIFTILLALFVLAALSFAPWVPTKSRDVKRAIELSGLRSGEVFYDLGCGDGRAIFVAEKNFGADARGIEIFLPLYFLCVVKKFTLHLCHSRENGNLPLINHPLPPPAGDKIGRSPDQVRGGQSTFLCKNLFTTNLSDADVVFFFGTEGPLIKRLPEKLERELKPGTRVISYVFPIPSWNPTQISKGERNDELSIFCYIIGQHSNLQKGKSM